MGKPGANEPEAQRSSSCSKKPHILQVGIWLLHFKPQVQSLHRHQPALEPPDGPLSRGVHVRTDRPPVPSEVRDGFSFRVNETWSFKKYIVLQQSASVIQKVRFQDTSLQQSWNLHRGSLLLSRVDPRKYPHGQQPFGRRLSHWSKL